MNLTKKQVKAFLEVISNDDSRPVLCTASVQMFKDRPYLVATDSYKLTALLLDESFKNHVGKVVTRDDLTKWYKLAGTRDVLNPVAVEDMLTDASGKYPEWQALMPEEFGNRETVYFNSKYLLTMETLADKPLKYKFAKDMLYAEDNGNIYVVMSLRG